MKRLKLLFRTGMTAIIKSRILFIRGVKRYVFIKKPLITIPATIPKENSASAKNKNIARD